MQLRFAIEVFRRAGVRGDRIEHASIAPPDAIDELFDLGLTVATQPGFIATRGDEYLDDVDTRDLASLYPTAALLRTGVKTLGSTDAPFGLPDPWQGMRAAVHRRTDSGTIVGPSQCVTPAQALAFFGGAEPIRIGMPADLVLLAVPLSTALRRLTKNDVVLTIVDGVVVHDGRR